MNGYTPTDIPNGAPQPTQAPVPPTQAAPGGDLWATLPPQERQKYLSAVLKLDGLNRNRDSLNQDIQQNSQDVPHVHHTTALGAGIGALGEVLATIGMKRNDERLRKERTAEQAKIDAARSDYANGLLGAGTPKPVIPAQPFGDPSQNMSRLSGGY